MIGTCYAMTHCAINTHERKKCEVKQLLLWEKISRPPNKTKNTAGEAAKDEGNILYAWKEIKIHI